MPTSLFLKEGKRVDKILGAKKDGLQLTITKHAVGGGVALYLIHYSRYFVG